MKCVMDIVLYFRCGVREILPADIEDLVERDRRQYRQVISKVYKK